MPTSKATNHYSDGRAVDVTLTHTVQAEDVALVEGWLGITGRSGDSGDSVALTVDAREYVFSVPTALAVVKGEVVYVTLASVTEHTVPDAAYSKTAGAGKLALFRATEDQDANDNVTGILLVKGNV